MFDVEERREYMRQYYHRNKYKWDIYYKNIVLPKFREARKIKEQNKKFKKTKGKIIIIFD
jgi:hypothetical protein